MGVGVVCVCGGGGGVDSAMINQNYLFHLFVTKKDPIIIKTLNLKFENVSFTNFQKNINYQAKKICWG